MEDSSNNFLCSKDGRCSEPGWGADTEMWLGCVPWQSTRVLCSTRGPGTFSETCQIRHRLASSHNGGILLTNAQFSGGNWQERRKQNKQPNPYTPYKSDLEILPQGCQKVEKMIPRPVLGNLIFNVEKLHPIIWLSTCFLSLAIPRIRWLWFLKINSGYGPLAKARPSGHSSGNTPWNHMHLLCLWDVSLIIWISVPGISWFVSILSEVEELGFPWRNGMW